jgi:gamma-glutamyltranspeptidase/glutathione hydrolase
MPAMTLIRRAGLPLAALLTLAACSTMSDLRSTFLGGGSVDAQRVRGFLGGVVADEPTAALAGREVLALGGTAADAAVAVGFTLAVTYPSRASLGAGGACLAYSPARTGAGGGSPEAILFTPVAPTTTVPRTDRPAAVPMLARGLFALHARYGRRPFETLVVPAEQLARFGTRASRAFVRDLNLVAVPLMADPNAAAIFAPGGKPLAEGDTMIQAELGGTLSQIRTVGVGDLYQGTLGRRLEQGSALAGGGLTLADMRAALPKTLTPIVVPAGNDQVAFLPPPADGGLAAAAAFQSLQSTPASVQAANDRALAVAAAWRAGGVDAAALLAKTAPTAAPLPALPASTSFATLDRDGNAVVCVVTMDNLFGTGRVAPGTGVVLAASPASVPPPLLSAALAWNSNIRAFRAEVGGTGQAGAPLATALALQNTLHSTAAMPVPVPDPGRANVIACSQYLPDTESSCTWAKDPREAGLAIGSN